MFADVVAAAITLPEEESLPASVVEGIGRTLLHIATLTRRLAALPVGIPTDTADLVADVFTLLLRVPAAAYLWSAVDQIHEAHMINVDAEVVVGLFDCIESRYAPAMTRILLRWFERVPESSRDNVWRNHFWPHAPRLFCPGVVTTAVAATAAAG